MKKILIVEDGRAIAQALHMMLSGLGYETITSYGTEEAITAANEESPDLIVLDINMPDGGGSKVANEIRSNDKTKKIPIIIFTAVDKEDVKALTQELDIEAYISKPNTDTLIEKIKELLKE
ncbi:response regulator transcription factor [Elusimicrobiota bacterium]